MPPDDRSPSKPRRRSWGAYRASHRLRSHDEAHAAETDAPTAPVLDHPLVPAGPPTLISQPHQLDALIDRLRRAGAFGYDSEFIGEQSYHPRLCLIQVALPEGVTLIDALADLDLRPFWELLADARVEKIVHAGAQDIEPVARHLGRPAARVTDTQIAAAFAGLPYPASLRTLVQTLAGAELSQGSKFSQWDRRPLTPIQLRYAANDVRYLPLLRHVLAERLRATGNTAWAADECDAVFTALAEADAQPARLRLRGAETMRPRQRAVLAALLAWREEAAREQDVPPRALVKDGVLAEMAKFPARSVADLDRVRGLPRPVEELYGERIVALTQAALRAPLPDDAAAAPEREVERDAIEALWAAVQDRCRSRSIDPAIVTSKRELGQHLATGGESRLTRGWRAELLGDLLSQHRA